MSLPLPSIDVDNNKLRAHTSASASLMMKSLSDVLFDNIVETVSGFTDTTVCREFAGVEELSDEASRRRRSCGDSLLRGTDMTGEISSELAS